MSVSLTVYTEQEVIERERKAFQRGARCQFACGYMVHGTDAAAKRAYPDPVRPRVVEFEGNRWRFANGRFEFANNGGWFPSTQKPHAIRMLADLLSNPTEPLPSETAE